MVRGCQKKIIYLKNTHSDMFEEAYFVIRDSLTDERKREYDMVKEATKILNESFDFEKKQTLIKRIGCFIKKQIITFSCGIVAGSLITFLILT